MRFIVLPLCLAAGLLLSLAGCGDKQADTGHPKSYAKRGLKFEMPGNWMVTEDAEEDGSRYLFIEEPGDALVVIQFVDESAGLDITEYARNFAASAGEETPIGQIDASKFSSVGSSHGGELLVERFSITLLGVSVPHTRQYHRKTFGKDQCFIVAQVADEDRAKVTAGFDQIVRSLTYERP